LGLRLETLNHFPVPAKTREGFPLEHSRLNCALAPLVRDDVIARDAIAMRSSIHCSASG